MFNYKYSQCAIRSVAQLMATQVSTYLRSSCVAARTGKWRCLIFHLSGEKTLEKLIILLILFLSAILWNLAFLQTADNLAVINWQHSFDYIVAVKMYQNWFQWNSDTCLLNIVKYLHRVKSLRNIPVEADLQIWKIVKLAITPVISSPYFPPCFTVTFTINK